MYANCNILDGAAQKLFTHDAQKTNGVTASSIPMIPELKAANTAAGIHTKAIHIVLKLLTRVATLLCKSVTV